ncbi:MAG TPA: aminopeptidase P N-terminal domain-containing protein [Longimicrobiales bacterium]|nr:aminopeptidase P N-terminal domain-containing protein [Longimicrobiales bacterium]
MLTSLRRLVLLGGCFALLPLTVQAQTESPAGPVPPSLLQQRRARLLDRIGEGIAIVHAAEPRSIEGEYPQDSDYRESNDFFYLTGLETPGASLVLLAHSTGEDSVMLYVPARDPAAEVWTGPRLGPGPEAQRITGVQDVRPAGRFEADVAGWLRSGREALYVDVPMARRAACGGDPTGGPQCAPILETLDVPGGTRVASVSEHIAALRLVKDADELRRLREAIRITGAAHRAAAAALEPGVWEYEVEAVIEYTFRSMGAERVGFPSIVGSGPFSTILHYDRSRRRTADGDLIVIDIGAEYGYYSADITRTYPVSGRFTDRQRAVYDLVLSTQQAAIDAVRPGTTIGALTRIAREHMRANSGDLCRPVTCDAYFIHGLSHWLGMDVHDVGSYDVPLAPGMVLTIEPGIYIPDEELGVRIEDDVLVTADGHELLSGSLPRDAAAIEQMMQQPARALQR